MNRRGLLFAVLLVTGTYLVSDSAISGQLPRNPDPMSALWEAPTDLRNRDLFNGPWGARYAPNPHATYTFVKKKRAGVNPGVIVRDPQGRTWHVKQSDSSSRGSEGPVEVAISRVLSAIGYHQPPVYYLNSFTMKEGSGTHLETGGRFRLDVPSMHDRGNWRWRRNPFVGTRPHQGLIVTLLVFNSFDLKDSNNTLYDIQQPGRVGSWYVVRDLGGALGQSGRFFVQRNNISDFEKQRFITGYDNRFVVFNYRGQQASVVRDQITLEDVRWATALLGGLSDRQWHDAFRAGNYPTNLADRFIRQITLNIQRGQEFADPGRRANAWR